MKKLYPFLILFLISITSSFAQNVMFYDINFKNALLEDPNINTNGDGEISKAEAQAATYMDVYQKNISDMTGIQEFPNLKTLYCDDNSLTNLDVSVLTNLEELACGTNFLTNLDVSGLTNLKTLYCYQNDLNNLNVSGANNLEFLSCFENELTSLNINGLTNLEYLSCEDNSLTSLDASGLANLEKLYSNKNKLSSLNVSGATNLKLIATHQNSLENLDVSGLTNLDSLYCYENKLSSLNVSGATNLKLISCHINSLTSLNASGLPNLEELYCYQNELTSLNVNGLTNLKYLYCEENSLTSLDASGLTNLIYVYCYENELTNLNVSDATNLELISCFDNSLTSLDASGLTNLVEFYCYQNELTSIDIRNTGSIYFLDAEFNPELECIVVDDLMSVPDYVWIDKYPTPYTTTPCIIMDFDDLSDVIDDSGISPYLAATLNATADIAEESCSQGSKNTTIYTLASLKLMVKRSRQIGRLNAAQASELTDGIDMLIDNIRSGAVDCEADTDKKKNILDWINEWFSYNLETPEVSDNATTLDTRSHTVQSVYPNPTSGRVNFAQPDQQVVVYNMLGKVMQKAEGTDHVDLSTYQPGVYVIQLRKGEERSVHQVVKR